MPDFLSKAKFSRLVASTVQDKKISYMEAVLHLCEEHDIDPGEVKKFLSKAIKEKIEVEAQQLNFLPKSNALPA